MRERDEIEIHVYIYIHPKIELFPPSADLALDNIYIYIYIYCHPQSDSFVVSQLFSVARHAGRLKLGSKPV